MEYSRRFETGRINLHDAERDTESHICLVLEKSRGHAHAYPISGFPRNLHQDVTNRIMRDRDRIRSDSQKESQRERRRDWKMPGGATAERPPSLGIGASLEEDQNGLRASEADFFVPYEQQNSKYAWPLQQGKFPAAPERGEQGATEYYGPAEVDSGQVYEMAG